MFNMFPLLGGTNFSGDCDLVIFNFVKWELMNFYTVCVYDIIDEMLFFYGDWFMLLIDLYVMNLHQLVDKDPERAIPLFWAAINSGDRVDSALKDMAIVMKQQNRSEEAIEAIKSLRIRCSDQSQESLDNILLDLYKVLIVV